MLLDVRARRLIDVGADIRGDLVRKLGTGAGSVGLHARQLLAQLRAGAVQPALERPHLEAGDGGCLLGGETLDVAQDDDLPRGFGQREDGRLEQRADLAGFGAVVRTLFGRFDLPDFGLVEREVPLRFSCSAPPALQAEAARDLVEPGGERRVAAELVQALEGGDERLLQHVARRLFAPAHAQAEAVHLLLVALEQLLDGGGISRLRSCQQLSFGLHGGSVAPPRRRCRSRRSGPGAGLVAHPQAAQNSREEAPAREGALQQVCAHEGGDEQEGGSDEEGERGAEEHEPPGEGEDEPLDGHDRLRALAGWSAGGSCMKEGLRAWRWRAAARPRRATRK